MKPVIGLLRIGITFSNDSRYQFKILTVAAMTMRWNHTTIIAGMMLSFWVSDAYAQLPAAQTVPATAETQAASSESTDATESTVTQMLAFFDGLDEAIGDDLSDCASVADELENYYEEHHKWINKLIFATENADPEIIEQVRLKATAFGKKLSVCYNEPRIPELLQKYAKAN